jgi:hypothetical protein
MLLLTREEEVIWAPPKKKQNTPILKISCTYGWVLAELIASLIVASPSTTEFSVSDRSGVCTKYQISSADF